MLRNITNVKSFTFACGLLTVVLAISAPNCNLNALAENLQPGDPFEVDGHSRDCFNAIVDAHQDAAEECDGMFQVCTTRTRVKNIGDYSYCEATLTGQCIDEDSPFVDCDRFEVLQN